jgi:hypothetical protein
MWMWILGGIAILYLINSQREPLFVARAAGCLFDLGLATYLLTKDQNKLFGVWVVKEYKANGWKANPRRAAVQAYVELIKLGKALPEEAFVANATFDKPLRALEAWAESGKLEVELANEYSVEIRRIVIDRF